MPREKDMTKTATSEDSFQVETTIVRQLKEASKKIRDLSVQLAKFMEAWREIVNASLEHLKEYEEGTAAVRDGASSLMFLLAESSAGESFSNPSEVHSLHVVKEEKSPLSLSASSEDGVHAMSSFRFGDAGLMSQKQRERRLCEEEAEEHRGLGYKLPFKFVASEDDGGNDDDGKEREEAEEAEEVGEVGERGDGRQGMGKAEEGQEAENIVDEIIEEGVCDGRVGLLLGSEDEHCFVETRTLEERRLMSNTDEERELLPERVTTKEGVDRRGRGWGRMDKWMVRRKEGGLVGDRMGELGCLGDAAVSSSYYDEDGERARKRRRVGSGEFRKDTNSSSSTENLFDGPLTPKRPRSPRIPDEKGSETSKDGHEVFAAQDPGARERMEDPTFKARIYFQPDPDYDIEAR